MKFHKDMMMTDIKDRISKLKGDAAVARVTWPELETIKMVNGTEAAIYTMPIQRLIQWPYGNYAFDHVEDFLASNASMGRLLYQFKDGPDTLYIGKSLNGIKRSLGHINGTDSYNQPLHQYITQSNPYNLTVTYYALTLSPTLPNELIEQTVLEAEAILITKYSPTRFNKTHNHNRGAI